MLIFATVPWTASSTLADDPSPQTSNRPRNNPLRSKSSDTSSIGSRPNPIRPQRAQPVVRRLAIADASRNVVSRPIRRAGFDEPVEQRRNDVARSEDDHAFVLHQDDATDDLPDDIPDNFPDDLPDDVTNDLPDDLTDDLFRDPPDRTDPIQEPVDQLPRTDDKPTDKPKDKPGEKPGDKPGEKPRGERLKPLDEELDRAEKDSDAADREKREDKQADAEAKHLKRCQRDIRLLRQATLSKISLDISPKGKAGDRYPQQCELEVNDRALPNFRGGEPMHVAWAASGLCHKPLYFEERGLERYGHSTGPITQPILSAAHFFGSIPILPYKIGLRTPNECVYTLGHYRPGDCAPYYVPAIPFTWRAGLFQAGATVGAAYLLP